MGDKIFIIEGETLQPVHETEYQNEAMLQKFIENYSELIGADQISPENPPNLVLIRREMPIADKEDSSGRWSLDHLFVDDSGILTFVEVKRSKNPEIRREIVGQLLEYAANADKYLSISQIISQGNKYWQSKKGMNLDSVIYEAFSENEMETEENFNLEDFWKKLEYNIKRGIVRIIFAADKLPSELKRIIEYLNMQCENMEVLGLEIKYFTGAGNKNIFIPRIVGQTEQARESKQGEFKKKAKQWDENAFLDDLIQRKFPDNINNYFLTLHEFIKKEADIADYGIGVGYGSFNYRIKIESSMKSIFTINTNGLICFCLRHLQDVEIEKYIRDEMQRIYKVKLKDKPFPNIRITDVVDQDVNIFIGMIRNVRQMLSQKHNKLIEK